MNPFTYTRAPDKATAIREVTSAPQATFLGGGTNLVDLMKEGVEHPDHLVDIHRLPLDKIEENAGGLRIGAMATNSDVANHSLVREHYPLLAQALLAGASPQLRNMATVGGNLMQRTRCFYFYDTAMPCNKRQPGSGCGALHGFNRIHAILGASEQCVAVHPSDLCVALAALDASVEVEDANGAHSISFEEFHRLPGDTPQYDTTLKHGELITSVTLPASALAAHSHYLKVRDRASYAFALVSVAAALELNEDKIRSARIVLGGVAHKPWRASQAEKSLIGANADEKTFAEAADLALQSAQPLKHNAFKVALAQRSIVRALLTALQGTEKFLT